MTEQKTAQRQSGLAFLKLLGQAAQEASLYRSSHPMAVAALGEAYKAFEGLVSEMTPASVTVALAQDRWLINSDNVASTSQAPEILKAIYLNHGIGSLTFLRGAKLYEFTALCELAAAPKNGGGGFLADYLKQRGVRNIRPDDAVYTRSQARHKPAEPGEAEGRDGQGKSQAQERGGGFVPLLKGLVEGAVSDPRERARVYADALKTIKEALDRQAALATRSLEQEKEKVSMEQGRAERVLSAAAEGKVIVDRQGNVLMMNPAAEEISGKSLAEIAGKPLAEAVKPDEQMLAISADLDLKPGRPLSETVPLLAEAMVERAIRRSVAIVHDEAGRVVGTYAALPDAAKFKEAQKLQEEFVSRITHELNAPLTSISSALELMEESLGSRLGPEESEYLAICVRNSRRLHEMIDEVLDFSRIESGGLSVRLAPCVLAPVMRETVQGLAPWARKKEVSLTAAPVDARLTPVLADRARVLQILTNLASNAIKSTAPGGTIELSACRGDQSRFWSAVVSVRDTGCGIAAENLNKIFEKFVQLDDPQGRREGIGLGLSIVRDLVRSQGGSVWAESQLGRGSAFYFTLPLAGAPAAQEALWMKNP
ncbi:MAG TPA: PAS domain-containing sensor histidine kinase [Elusimicrobiota bacterium]|nr:PAS domain-containing sensor histidine kinase [Elusimicrobiota bacterium]